MEVWSKSLMKRKVMADKIKKKEVERKYIAEERREIAQEKAMKKAQFLASLQQERNEARRKIMQKSDGKAAASAGRQGNARSVYLEEQAIKRAENMERIQTQQMNLQRRKRLQQEYKAVLIQQ